MHNVKSWMKVAMKIILFTILYLFCYHLSRYGLDMSFYGSVLFSSIITYIAFITYLSVKVTSESVSLYILLIPYLLVYCAIVGDMKSFKTQHKIKPSHIIKDSTSVSLIENGTIVTSDKIEHYNNQNLFICYDTHVNGFEDTVKSTLYVCK